MAARLWGQRVIKKGVKGLSPAAAAASGLREGSKDFVAALIALPLRVAFRAIFGLARGVRKLRGGAPQPAL